MQTAINPALAAAMTLEQAAQVGEFSPVTKDGIPTVVGGKLQQALQPMMPQGIPQGMPGMQRAAPPSVPQVAQQAGLGGQIQAMQMQEAQKAMMNAAMQQARPPAGIERLNPQMGNFAEGGIVGYNGKDGSVAVDPGSEGGSSYGQQVKKLAALLGLPLAAAADLIALPYSQYKNIREPGSGYTPASDVLRRIVGTPEAAPSIAEEADREAARFAQDVPYGTEGPARREPMQQVAPAQERRMPVATASSGPAAPATPAAPQGVAALFQKERDELAKLKGPATAQEILAREQMDRPTYEQFLRSRGIDPDMLTKRGEEDKALIEQQRALLRERMEREQGRDTFLSRAGAAMRGFRQMKGQGIGDAVAGAHDNLARQLQAGEIRMDQFRDAEIRLNELEITRRRALDDARRATAEGDWNRASQALTTERNATNEIIKLTAPTYGKQATAMVQERQAQEAGAARRADQNRIQELYQLRLNTLAGGKQPTDEQKMEAMEYALQTVKGAGSAARTAMAGQRLSLDQLRALQKTYTEQAENMLLPQVQRDQAAQMLKQVNDEIAASAGIGAPRTGGQVGTVLKFDERGNLIK